MEYEWDEGKREANLIKHGVDFTEVYNFQWEKAQIKADTRIIGLRKANKREKMTYENKT